MEHTSAQELKTFYESPIGITACKILRSHLTKILGTPKKEKILGIGFTLPFLPVFESNNHCISFLVPELGVAQTSSDIESVIIDEGLLPLRNETIDKVIIAHTLENIERLDDLLAQIWRILKPNGKILIISTNESGFWRNTKTPFSKGRAICCEEIATDLMVQKFYFVKTKKALFFPPIKFNQLAIFAEKYCRFLLAPFCGVYITTATKLVFAPRDRGRPTKITQSIIEKLFKPKSKPIPSPCQKS
jgi:SAM-dependent methyltransferase